MNAQPDKWDLSANRHLFAYIQRRPGRYHPDSKLEAVRVTDGWVHQAIAGPVGTAVTKILIAAKDAWAANMREEAEGKGVDVETQKALWIMHMRKAEEQIDALLSPVEV